MNFDPKPYNQNEVNNLKRVLTSAAQDGKTLTFEIKLDNYTIIHETTNVERFDELFDFINENSQKLVITLGTPNSRNKEWHTFLLNGLKTETPMNGVNDVEKLVGEKMSLFTERAAAERLLEKLKATEEQLDQANDYIDTLTTKLDELKAKPNHFGGFDLGRFTGSAVSELVRNYPKALDNIPVLNGFARALNGSNNEDLADTAQESEMSFKAKSKEAEKTASNPQATHNATNGSPEHEEDENLTIAKKLSDFLSENFTPNQRLLVEGIIIALAENPSSLITVADLLNIDTGGMEGT
jgi:hypothetical protein